MDRATANLNRILKFLLPLEMTAEEARMASYPPFIQPGRPGRTGPDDLFPTGLELNR